ncbi:MAG: LytTR family DNA-binding domain-containing protein [Eubacteriales bacterium]
MLRIAICDDNNTICTLMEQMVLDYAKGLTVQTEVEVFNRGEDLLLYIKNEKAFDLIFLDIELGTTTGIKVGTTIREEFDDHSSKIVFITSKQGYEKELFDIQPLYFLSKPISTDGIIKSMNLAIKLLDIDNTTFEYKKNYDVIKVKIKDILYFEKERRRTKIVTRTGEDYFYESIRNIQSKLSDNFIAPQSAFLVNFNKIARLQKNNLILVDGTEIFISRRNLPNIRIMLIASEKERSHGKL